MCLPPITSTSSPTWKPWQFASQALPDVTVREVTQCETSFLLAHTMIAVVHDDDVALAIHGNPVDDSAVELRSCARAVRKPFPSGPSERADGATDLHSSPGRDLAHTIIAMVHDDDVALAIHGNPQGS